MISHLHPLQRLKTSLNLALLELVGVGLGPGFSQYPPYTPHSRRKEASWEAFPLPLYILFYTFARVLSSLIFTFGTTYA